MTLRQVYFTAAQALPLTLFVALAIGVLLMQQVRALEAMGINVDRYIVAPRGVGMVLSVTLLTGVFCATSVYGGYFIARMFDALPSDFVLAELMRSFTPSVLFNILVRAFCFGFVIASVACVHGLRVRSSAADVPKEASRSVVRALSICVAINFLIATFIDLETGR